MLTLNEISTILGCSKPAASMVRNNRYDRPGSDLPERYRALIMVIERAAGAARADDLCLACPREDCSGCRVADISE